MNPTLTQGNIYEITKQFDAYYCSIGRVTVNPGAQFIYDKNERIFFIHTQNHLPYEAKQDFMCYGKFKIIEDKRESETKQTNLPSNNITFTKDYKETGITDKNGNEIIVGDIVRSQYGGDKIIEPFDSHIIGAFSYRPLGATNEGSSYLLGDLMKNAPITIVKPVDNRPLK